MRTQKQQRFSLFSCVLCLTLLLFSCADSNKPVDPPPVDPQTDMEVSSAMQFTSGPGRGLINGDVNVPGSIWFEEDTTSEGEYHSSLFFFGDDSSFQQYNYQDPPDASNVQSGEWSVDESGNLLLSIPGQNTITVQPKEEYGFLAYLGVLIDDGTGAPYNAEWFFIGPYSFDDSSIPGSYTDEYGDTWVFESDATGSAPGQEGTFLWEVVDGLLVVSFPDGREYWMYNIGGKTPFTEEQFYPEIDCACVEYAANGEFDSYHGGMELIRQGAIIPDTVPANELLEHGAIWFQDNTTSAGVYHSSLYFFGDDSSFQQYNYQSSPETSNVQSGEWSIDEAGNLILNIPGQETVAATVVNVIGFGVIFYWEVLIDDAYNAEWWSCDPEFHPFDESLIAGTYTDEYGDTWIFESNGTGSAPGEEGSFMWEVVDGLLVVFFPEGREYWMYNIPARGQYIWPWMHFYPRIYCAYVEYAANGDFDSYHGGMELIRQE